MGNPEAVFKAYDIRGIVPSEMDGMLACMKHDKREYCTACWSGEYKIPIDQPQSKFSFERDQLKMF